MSNSRTIALAAYHAAVAAPVAADWPSVAALLVACLPKLRGAVRPAVSADGAVPAWWADYVPGKKFRTDSAEVTFADGRRVRLSVLSNPGKPLNIGRAVRIACAFYRSKVHNALGAPVALDGTTLHGPADHVAVPAIAHVECETTGEEFDAATCTAMTEAARAGMWSESDARHRAERLAVEPGPQAGHDVVTIMRSLFVRAWDVAFGDVERAARAANVAKHERAAIEAPARRLARCEAARVERAVAMVRAGIDPAEFDQAAWCDAVADGYGEPGAFVIGETVEAGADAPDAAAAPSPVESDPAPVPPVAAPVALPAPVEAVAHPPVAIADVPAPVGIPSSDAPEAIADAWEPTPESHPVTVLCLSDKAQERLFDRIQDGTFPAADRTAKGGAWRLTVEDARDCADIGSLRFLGLPRKAYTRRTVPTPLAAIPLAGIRTDIAVPAGAFIPSTPAGPVVYHAAPKL